MGTRTPPPSICHCHAHSRRDSLRGGLCPPCCTCPTQHPLKPLAPPVTVFNRSKTRHLIQFSYQALCIFKKEKEPNPNLLRPTAKHPLVFSIWEFDQICNPASSGKGIAMSPQVLVDNGSPHIQQPALPTEGQLCDHWEDIRIPWHLPRKILHLIQVTRIRGEDEEVLWEHFPSGVTYTHHCHAAISRARSQTPSNEWKDSFDPRDFGVWFLWRRVFQWQKPCWWPTPLATFTHGQFGRGCCCWTLCECNSKPRVYKLRTVFLPTGQIPNLLKLIGISSLHWASDQGLWDPQPIAQRKGPDMWAWKYTRSFTQHPSSYHGCLYMDITSFASFILASFEFYKCSGRPTRRTWSKWMSVLTLCATDT